MKLPFTRIFAFACAATLWVPRFGWKSVKWSCCPMRLKSISLFSVLGLLLLAGSAAQGGSPPFPKVSALPPQSALPDPLVMLDGRRVDSSAQWVNERRPELLALFQHYMYGSIPPAPERAQTKVLGEYPDFLGGKATLKLVKLEMAFPPSARNSGSRGNEAKPDQPSTISIDLMLVVPNQRPATAPRSPVFLAMNFCGNHALTGDPRVPLTSTWLGSSCPGCPNNAATDAARGKEAVDWPLAEILRRGYGLAAFYSGDVDSDRRDISSGLYACLAGGDPARNNPTNRGTIAAWAWGFHRCVDYLVTDRDVDPHRIAAFGHSRNGKTALLAAAFDPRIAIAFPHQAGCGGSAPSRGKTGESVKAINDRFPHWFNAQFKQFNDAPERLPFDQNCLVALCAPRPVLFSAAEGDQWANPRGQFQVLQGAGSVYRLLGTEGFTAKEIPPLGKLVDSPLGYYVREGKHSTTADDWTVFMNFADRHWGSPKEKAAK